jgi:hypothetical protein
MVRCGPQLVSLRALSPGDTQRLFEGLLAVLQHVEARQRISFKSIKFCHPLATACLLYNIQTVSSDSKSCSHITLLQVNSRKLSGLATSGIRLPIKQTLRIEEARRVSFRKITGTADGLAIISVWDD